MHVELDSKGLALLEALLTTAQRERLSLKHADALLVARRASLCEVIFNTLPTPLQSLPTRGSMKARARLLRDAMLCDESQPMFDLVDRCLSLGIVVVSGTSPFSLCIWLSGVLVLFIGSDLPPGGLYGAARVLGWGLNSIPERDDDFAVTAVQARISTRSSRERNARNFAEHLLLPTQGLAFALQEVRRLLRIKSQQIGDIELLYLSRIFGVPFENAARRCEEEGLLPAGGAKALELHLKDDYGGPEQRAEAVGLPARPIFTVPIMPYELLALGAPLASQNVLSSEELCELAGVSLEELSKVQT